MTRSILLLSVLLFAACDTLPVEPTPRTYRVEYVVESTFDECRMTHTNASSGLTQTVAEAFPWRKGFEAEVDSRFYVGLIVSCFGGENAASGAVLVNGDTLRAGGDRGTYVSLDLDLTLTRDGIE